MSHVSKGKLSASIPWIVRPELVCHPQENVRYNSILTCAGHAETLTENLLQVTIFETIDVSPMPSWVTEGSFQNMITVRTKYKFKWLILTIIVAVVVSVLLIPDPPQCIAYSFNAIKILVIAQIALGLVYLGLMNAVKNT